MIPPPLRPLLLGKYQAWTLALVTALVCGLLNVLHNHAGFDPVNRQLGGEYMRIATALSNGHGFANPFKINTGATGWMPPCYTFILYAIKNLTASGAEPGRAFLLTLITLKCLALGATAGLVWSILKTVRQPAYRLICFFPAWIILIGWASYDTLINDTHDGWWLAFVLALCFHAIVRLKPNHASKSLIVGLSLAALSSPVLFVALLLIIALRSASFYLKARRFTWGHALKPVLPAIIAGLLLSAGWTVRVHATTGIWAPLKTNGGFELWQSLVQTHNGIPSTSTFRLHPVNDNELKEEYVELGEKAFTEKYTRAAFAALRENPQRFLHHVGNRLSNAFVWMNTRSDCLYVQAQLPASIIAELTREHLAVMSYKPTRVCFLFCDNTEEQRALDLARLSPESRNVLIKAREHYDRVIQDLPFVDRFALKGLMLSGIITLAWAVAFLLARPHQRRRLLLPLALYLTLLAPYCLISHYDRYQTILAPLQLYILAVAAAYVVQACVAYKNRERTPLHRS